jgi:hypothetical protein
VSTLESIRDGNIDLKNLFVYSVSLAVNAKDKEASLAAKQYLPWAHKTPRLQDQRPILQGQQTHRVLAPAATQISTTFDQNHFVGVISSES